MSSKQVQSPFGEVLNPFNVHESFFTDILEAKYAIRGVLRAYFGSSQDQEDDYLFFKSSTVRFEENPELDLELDHRRRIVIFVVKEPTGKDAESLKSQIRNQISMQFAVLASDSRGRTAMSIYRALDPTAKLAVIEAEKQKEAPEKSHESK